MKNSVPVIVQTVAKHSYWVESIFTGLRQSAEKSDYELKFVGSVESVDKTMNRECETIIVIGYAVDWLQHTVDSLLKKGFQPIIANAWISPAMLKYCNGVSFGLEESVENCIKYLSAAGRNKISLFGTNCISLADRFKEETFKRVVKNYNEDGNVLILPGENPISEHIEVFLKRFEEMDIDAVICPNDTVAIQLINRMLKDGFKIPEDLYIIGMGNSLLGQKISIPLSSIIFDYEEMGRQAFSLWRYLQRSTGKVHMEVSIPCRFIPRASTGDFAQIETEFVSISDGEVTDKDLINEYDEFYEDIDVQKIIKFEVFLRSCDEIDYCVLEGIIKGNSDAKMAEQYNISDRAIRYRINKMTKKLGVHTREEIANILCELRAFGGEH